MYDEGQLSVYDRNGEHAGPKFAKWHRILLGDYRKAHLLKNISACLYCLSTLSLLVSFLSIFLFDKEVLPIVWWIFGALTPVFLFFGLSIRMKLDLLGLDAIENKKRFVSCGLVLYYIEWMLWLLFASYANGLNFRAFPFVFFAVLEFGGIGFAYLLFNSCFVCKKDLEGVYII